MTVQLKPIEPSASSIHPEVVAFYPYTFNGDFNNTAERLQAVANKVGVTVVAGELLGQDTGTIFDLKAGPALKPGKPFESTCQRTADFVRKQLEDWGFTTRIGFGMSLGGTAIAGMQHYADAKPFMALHLSDSTNLRAPQSPARGYSFYTSYLVADWFHGRQASQPQTAEVPVSQPEVNEETLSITASVSRVLRNIHNLSPLMRSSEGRNTVIGLARDLTLPLHVIGYENGMAGTSAAVRDFHAQLHDVRLHAAVFDQRGRPPARLITERRKGWHSYLTQADEIAATLTTTLAMVI